MNNVLRSKQGCWTCRLRRKKCDEKHPFCSTCEALKITCYGYGAKPDWMDNGEKEKAMANSIKLVVKKTSRQKGRLGMSMNRFQPRPVLQKEDGLIKMISKSTLDRADANAELKSLGEDNSNSPETLIGSSNAGPSPVSDHLDRSDGSARTTGWHANTKQAASGQSSDGHSELSLSWLSAIKNDEAVLLMHFVDTVFPLQYPMYKPSIIGGRGWLLSLLLRTKPLYHASLALSAYHRETVFLSLSSACSTHSTVDKEKHLAICLSEFQQTIKEVGRYLDSACPSNALGLMACVIQLVFFELFAGHVDTWKIHLNAATDIFCRGYWDQAMELGLVKSPSGLFDGQSTHIANFSRSAPEEAATFTFLSGVTIWLDILSCITSGKSPRLSAFHQHAICCTSTIKLEDIIGCQNWAVLQIAHISTLHYDRTIALQEGTLHMSDLEYRTDSIQETLRHGLAEFSLASLEISSITNFDVQPMDLTLEPFLITRIFALTASIYLHLVVHGYLLDTPAIRFTVEEAMTILRTKVPSQLMQAIIFPLYIIGSVAKKEDESCFRNFLSSRSVLDPSLEHRGRILPLLETIWRMRETTPSVWTWHDTVALSNNNLLLL